MPVIYIDRLDDPRLEPFVDLRHRNPTWVSRRFVTEGRLVTDRLIANGWPIESLFVLPQQLAHYADRVPSSCLVLVADEPTMATVVGYQFHRGVLACGIRPEIPRLLPLSRAFDRGEVLVGSCGVQDPENLGNLMRCAAAFGARRFVLGPQTADPLSRRALRVSMGTAFQLELLRSEQLAEDLRQLSQSAACRSVATVLDAGAISLDDYQKRGPILLLFGNEMHGLPTAVLDAVDDRVTLPMQLGTDSLNVGVAAGIFLYALTRPTSPPP